MWNYLKKNRAMLLWPMILILMANIVVYFEFVSTPPLEASEGISSNILRVLAFSLTGWLAITRFGMNLWQGVQLGVVVYIADRILSTAAFYFAALANSLSLDFGQFFPGAVLIASMYLPVYLAITLVAGYSAKLIRK
jgi:hypothetical protein